MQRESFKRYLSPNGLVIVGDRKEIQNLALREQNAVLVTGGFDVDQEVVNYANQLSGLFVFLMTKGTWAR